MTTLSKFEFFATIFAHFATPINEVCLEPLWPSCGHDANSTFLQGLPYGFKFCYTRSRSVKTWGSSIFFLNVFKFCDMSILLNLMQQTGFKWAKWGQKTAQTWYKIVNSLHQIQQIWKEMESTQNNIWTASSFYRAALCIAKLNFIW